MTDYPILPGTEGISWALGFWFITGTVLKEKNKNLKTGLALGQPGWIVTTNQAGGLGDRRERRLVLRRRHQPSAAVPSS